MSTSSAKKVLITGASSGIGASLAHRYAQHGAHVWVAARRKDRLDALVHEIEQQQGKATAVVLDVQQADDLEEVIGALDDEVGGFDVVVANAGVGGGGRTASSIRYADAKRVFEINFMGAIATLLAAQQKMMARGRGQLVAVSSLAGEIALPVALDYGATKAGFSYFVRGMRHDLKSKGIGVTLILPGFVKSEMTDKNKFPMPFIITADQAAHIMWRGIEKNTAVVRFPLAYRLAFLFAGLVPSSLVGWAALRTAPPPAE